MAAKSRMGIAHRLANTGKFEADAKLRIKSFLLACSDLKEETCDSEPLQQRSFHFMDALPCRQNAQALNTVDIYEVGYQSQEGGVVNDNNNMQDAWRHGATDS